MSFESGALSFRAFYLSREFDPSDIDLFARAPLPPIKTLTGDQPLCGWVGPTHALDAELTEEHCWRGDWLWFAYTSAQKKVPPSLLRAMLLCELETERRARGVEVLPRAAKTEVKERVTEALTREAQPSFASMEFAIDLRRQRLLATVMNDAAIQTVGTFFRQTTAAFPTQLCPESAAARLCGIDCNDLELINFTPNPEIGVPPEITLGTEFLTWLFYRWEKEEATFTFNDETCGLMFEGPLTFAGDKGPGCHETVLRKGTPLDTPEFGIALWNGKKLRRAKLTLTKADWVLSATVDGMDFSFRSLKVDPVKKAAQQDSLSEMPSQAGADPAEAKRKLEIDERLDRAAFYVDAFLHLYEEFLRLRQDPVTWRAQLAKIQPWIKARANVE